MARGCCFAAAANERREKKASSSRGELYTLMTVTAIGSAMNGKALLARWRMRGVANAVSRESKAEKVLFGASVVSSGIHSGGGNARVANTKRSAKRAKEKK